MGVLSGKHIVIVPAWWPSPEQPGAGSFFVDFASAFAVEGAQVGVIFPDLISMRQLLQPGSKPWRPVISLETCADEIPVVRIRGISATFGRPLAYMQRFRDWLDLGLHAYSEGFGTPDLIHAGCLLPSGWAATHLDHALARRVVVTEETGPFADVMNHPVRARLARSAVDRAAALVAVSKVLADEMRQHGITRSIQICGNPVAPVFLEFPVLSKTKNPRLRAVFVGRLTRLKGLDELTAVIDRLDKERCSIDWHVIGPEMHLGARKLDGRLRYSRLTLMGPQDRMTILNELKNADLFVFPTHVETFGIAVAEALCMGVPVVTTMGTGCAGFINEANGILCLRANADSLYDAVRDLLERLSSFDRQQIAAAARTSFSSSALAAQYADIFDGTLRAT